MPLHTHGAITAGHDLRSRSLSHRASASYRARRTNGVRSPTLLCDVFACICTSMSIGIHVKMWVELPHIWSCPVYLANASIWTIWLTDSSKFNVKLQTKTASNKILIEWVMNQMWIVLLFYVLELPNYVLPISNLKLYSLLLASIW